MLVAGFLPSSTDRALISSSSILSICSPWISFRSRRVIDLTFCVWRTITSMCLSLIATPVAGRPLDFVDEVAGELLDALDRQDVVRSRIALDDESPFSMVRILQVCLPFGMSTPSAPRPCWRAR
jgi:hypothetical protein